MSGFSFEWTIKAGDVLTMGGALVVAVGIILSRVRDDTRLQSAVATAITEISELKNEFKKFGEILINQADQNRRIIHLEEDVRELRHGRGFVRGVGGIDREYAE